MQALCCGWVEDLGGEGAEEDIERELSEAALGSGSKDCVTLYTISIFPSTKIIFK